ncbi:unnamed protein product [Didymodactylos carnosus]|uniref:Uncharacterized protein n=1 Tax=Didymodactylos carnosus TaxID=1234261 RepID=A0A8S2FF95_9BILA|nr:unnamed protein product [Didymodactylos carnosus]CAF4243562.1 unnamed protein product [Didymodactylos carnosus]
MQQMYGFRVNFIKYIISATQNCDDEEELRTVAKTYLIPMMAIATEEALSTNPTNREFRNWLIWNECACRDFGTALNIAILTDYKNDLPKILRQRTSVPRTSITATDLQSFKLLLQESDGVLESLQKQNYRDKASVRAYAKKHFCSLLGKIVSTENDLYEQHKQKLQKKIEI